MALMIILIVLLSLNMFCNIIVFLSIGKIPKDLRFRFRKLEACEAGLADWAAKADERIEKLEKCHITT
jgi:hypothetical protein